MSVANSAVKPRRCRRMSRIGEKTSAKCVILALNALGRGSDPFVLGPLMPPVEKGSMHSLKTFRGRSLPLGAHALADGVNFALLCRHGTNVRLVLLPVDKDEILQ